MDVWRGICIFAVFLFTAMNDLCGSRLLAFHIPFSSASLGWYYFMKCLYRVTWRFSISPDKPQKDPRAVWNPWITRRYNTQSCSRLLKQNNFWQKVWQHLKENIPPLLSLPSGFKKQCISTTAGKKRQRQWQRKQSARGQCHVSCN